LGKRKIKEAIKELKKSGITIPNHIKSSCCKKYKKGKNKLCKNCPFRDLLKKAA
jgi:hypothetical protein